MIRIFESGSVLLYLIDNYDPNYRISYARGTPEYYEMLSWLFFQTSGVGPMQGQAHHFSRYAPERIEYGILRYSNETRRLYGVLDKHLATSESGYLVGNHISIADIALWGWVVFAGWANVEIDDFPFLKAWEERLAQHSGVEKGRHVPEPHIIKDILRDKKAMEEKAKQGQTWIQRGRSEIP